MKISIQRPDQIGGQITKISTSKASIIIDLGHNLPSSNGGEDPLANRKTVRRVTRGCDAVLYTHSHGDHIGLFQFVPKKIDQYVGEVAKEVMMCYHEHMMKVPDQKTSADSKRQLGIVKDMKTYKVGEPLKFGADDDIIVTPYLVSHSSCDAYMFLIEADGKRILHTGDFRGHGLRSDGLKSVLDQIGEVDVLIIEGTVIRRSDKSIMTEQELADRAENLTKQYKYTFVLCPSSDWERLAAFNYARIKSGRLLISDSYQNRLFKIFSNYADDINSSSESLNPFKFDDGNIYENRNYNDNNPKLMYMMKKVGFVMFVRASGSFAASLGNTDPADSDSAGLIDIIFRHIDDPAQSCLIYSAWSGYLSQPDAVIPGYVKLRQYFIDNGVKCEQLHTTGHASPEALLEVCEKTSPRTAIIPVHRDPDSDFGSIGISPDLQSKVITQPCTLDGIDISFNPFSQKPEISYDRVLTPELKSSLSADGEFHWIIDYVREHEYLDFQTGSNLDKNGNKFKSWLSIYKGTAKIVSIKHSDNKINFLVFNLYNHTEDDKDNSRERYDLSFKNNPDKDKLNTELDKIIKDWEAVEDKKHKQYRGKYYINQGKKKEGYYQTLISRRYSINGYPNDDFIIFDKEFVLGYRSDELRKEIESKINKTDKNNKSWAGERIGEIMAYYNNRKPDNRKHVKICKKENIKTGTECDFLGLTKDGKLKLLELKRYKDTMKIYLSPLQIGTYFKLLQNLMENEACWRTAKENIKKMIEQKKDLGIINKDWPIPTEICPNGIDDVELAVVVGGDKQPSSTAIERFKEVRKIILSNLNKEGGNREIKYYSCKDDGTDDAGRLIEVNLYDTEDSAYFGYARDAWNDA